MWSCWHVYFYTGVSRINNFPVYTRYSLWEDQLTFPILPDGGRGWGGNGVKRGYWGHWTMRVGFLHRINCRFNPILIQSGPTHDIINQSLWNMVLVLQGYGGAPSLALATCTRRCAECPEKWTIMLVHVFGRIPWISDFLSTLEPKYELVFDTPRSCITIINIHIYLIFWKGSSFEEPDFRNQCPG